MKGEHRQPQKRFGFAVVVGIGTTLAAIGALGNRSRSMSITEHAERPGASS